MVTKSWVWWRSRSIGWNIVHVNRLVPRHIPHQYVRFVITPGDGAYYLDTSRRDALGECPAVAFGPGEERMPVADSFLDFLGKARDGRA